MDKKRNTLFRSFVKIIQTLSFSGKEELFTISNESDLLVKIKREKTRKELKESFLFAVKVLYGIK